MCRKQGLDSRSDRQQQWDSQRAERYGRGPPRRDAQYGGPGMSLTESRQIKKNVLDNFLVTHKKDIFQATILATMIIDMVL